MSDFNVLIPKLGESIQEATITKLFVKQGDTVAEDDILFEIATDKVDSEIPSPVAGKIKEIRCAENDLVPVGQTVIIIEMEGEESAAGSEPQSEKAPGQSEAGDKKSGESPEIFPNDFKNPDIPPEEAIKQPRDNAQEAGKEPETGGTPAPEKEPSPGVQSPDGKQPVSDLDKEALKNSGRFYSPLVKSIASKEGISLSELESINGSGLGGRVQKMDIMNYVESRKSDAQRPPSQSAPSVTTQATTGKQAEKPLEKQKPSVSAGEGDTIVKMDRIRKLIANHMVMSKNVAPHVTTVVEADVTNMVLWRNAVKNDFEKKYGEKLTFMPLFTEAAAKALAEFRQVNASVDEDNIILRKHINIGIAVATNDGNLVVPVVRDADSKNLVGLSRDINNFAKAGRENKLNPDDLQGGTFTITNFGTFGGLIGTPIINQPQVAILAVGLIEKKPAVMETPTGDAIVVRHKMFLSLSYDHRVVDGMLGGIFLRRIADILEQFEQNKSI